MLALLNEIEDEDTAKSNKHFYYNNVVHDFLIKLELIEEDVEASLRIETEATYTTFLEELNKTVNLFLRRKQNTGSKLSYGLMTEHQKMK